MERKQFGPHPLPKANRNRVTEDLVRLLDDFTQLTGIPARLVSAEDRRTPPESEHSICQAQELCSNTALQCLRFHASLREAALESSQSAADYCRNGLWTGVLPIASAEGGVMILELGPVCKTRPEQLAAVMRLATTLTEKMGVYLEDGYRSEMKRWPESVVDAIHFMETHPSEEVTLEDLAQRVSLSPGHFGKVFAATTGHTPMRFLARLRLQKACGMLVRNPAMRVSEIALECGFESIPHFNRRFRLAFGCNPKEYRRNGLADLLVE